MTDKNMDAGDNSVEQQNQQPQSSPQDLYPRNFTITAEHKVNDTLFLQNEVYVWEVLSQESINRNLRDLEDKELQHRSAMERIQANNGKDDSEWRTLQTNHAEIVRKYNNFKNTYKVGDHFYKGKLAGLTQIHVGTEWNKRLVRHVIVGPDGLVKDMLWRPPV